MLSPFPVFPLQPPVGNKIKRGPGALGPWGPEAPEKNGKKKMPTPCQFPYSLVSQAWEGRYLPYPLIPWWSFLYPTLQGVVKGQPCLGTPPPELLC